MCGSAQLVQMIRSLLLSVIPHIPFTGLQNPKTYNTNILPHSTWPFILEETDLIVPKLKVDLACSILRKLPSLFVLKDSRFIVKIFTLYDMILSCDDV